MNLPNCTSLFLPKGLLSSWCCLFAQIDCVIGNIKAINLSRRSRVWAQGSSQQDRENWRECNAGSL